MSTLLGWPGDLDSDLENVSWPRYYFLGHGSVWS